MLRSSSSLQRQAIRAQDGEIGSVDRLFFDDQRWTVRHIVVDTGKWLPGRRVLISPAAVESIHDEGGTMRVRLTKEKIRNSPDIDTDQPVSRQQELELHQYYGFVPYWDGVGLWGGGFYPPALIAPSTLAAGGAAPPFRADAPPDACSSPSPVQTGDPHLRSTKEVAGYAVDAVDRTIGHVEDFLVDADTWAINYVLVDTSNWPGGKKVAIPASSVRSVQWDHRKISVDLTADAIHGSPQMPVDAPIGAELEAALRKHFRQPPDRGPR